MHEAGLPADLVDAVLARLGLARRPEPDADGLGAVYAAWCSRVPFDNVLKRIHIAEGAPGPFPGDRPADFFRTWLEHGSGGTCWAGNGALCELLVALGFRARRGVATMLVADDIPPNHGTVAVTLDHGAYLVDASMLFCRPLALQDASTCVEHPAHGVQCRRESGRWIVRWLPAFADFMDCRIESLDGSPEIYSRYHEATRAWGPFNYSVSARLVVDDRVVGMAFGEYGERDASGRRFTRPLDAGERTRLLVEQLGMSEEIAERCPPDQPLPPPPR
jgi:N-hydroxyarylamine O-acetyltransferase